MVATMDAHKTALIDLMVRSEVLTFGDFTAKSGRKTPYFINAGRYRTGRQIAELARLYAAAIRQRSVEFDVLFGPAYKGIPLVVATAMALCEDHGLDVGFCYNRKEAKDHGEGGSLVGQIPKDGDRVLILEDVTTAGTSIHETVPLLRAQADVTLAGLLVSVDRQERGRGQLNALAELEGTYCMDCFAIVTVDEIIESLRGRRIDGKLILTDELEQRMREYRAEYGGRS